MSATAATGEQFVETRIPARMDRLPWTRWHWRIIIVLGTVWILDGARRGPARGPRALRGDELAALTLWREAGALGSGVGGAAPRGPGIEGEG
jgi:hypothetical protein